MAIDTVFFEKILQVQRKIHISTDKMRYLKTKRLVKCNNILPSCSCFQNNPPVAVLMGFTAKFQQNWPPYSLPPNMFCHRHSDHFDSIFGAGQKCTRAHQFIIQPRNQKNTLFVKSGNIIQVGVFTFVQITPVFNQSCQN